eukprot:9468645-Pyramimonas_sp.AAC.1
MSHLRCGDGRMDRVQLRNGQGSVSLPQHTGCSHSSRCPAFLLAPSCDKLFGIAIRTTSGASRELRQWRAAVGWCP